MNRLLLLGILMCCMGLAARTTDAQTMGCSQTITDTTAQVVSNLAWLPDGARLAALDHTGLRVFDLSDKPTAIRRVQMNIHVGFDVTFRASGEQLAVAFQCDWGGAVTQAVQVFDVATGALRWHFDTAAGAFQVAFARDDTVLVVGGYQVQVWSLESGKLTDTFGEYQWGASSMALSSNERYLLAGNSSEASQLWDVQTGERITQLMAENLSAAFGPGDQRVVLGGTGRVTIFDLDTPDQLPLSFDTGIDQLIFGLDIHDDLIVLLHTSGELMLIDARGQVRDRVRVFPAEIENTARVGVAFNPDGAMLATSGEDYSIRLYAVGLDGDLSFIQKLR